MSAIQLPRVRPAVPGAVMGAQLLWIVLAMAWNLAGLWLIAHGERAPGPTASAATAMALFVVGCLLWWSRARRPWVYAALSALCGVLAALSVFNAFTALHSLWPSEFWRLAGAALNSVGALGAALALFCTAPAMRSRR